MLKCAEHNIWRDWGLGGIAGGCTKLYDGRHNLPPRQISLRLSNQGVYDGQDMLHGRGEECI